MLQFAIELGHEIRIRARVIRDAQFIQRRDQGFGDKNAAVRAEMAVCVRQISHVHCLRLPAMNAQFWPRP